MKGSIIIAIALAYLIVGCSAWRLRKRSCSSSSVLDCLEEQTAPEQTTDENYCEDMLSMDSCFSPCTDAEVDAMGDEVLARYFQLQQMIGALQCREQA